MQRWIGLLVCVWPVGLAGASEPQAAKNVVSETWDAAYLQGVKAGWVHTTVRKTTRDGRELLLTSMELNLAVRRFNDRITLRMETGNEETVDGKVSAVSMRQFLGKDQQLDMRGQVEDGRLHVQVDGGRRLDKRIPWNDDVIGLYRQLQIFRDRGAKPGDRFAYRSYQPTVTAVVTAQVAVKDYEDVESPLTKKRERLLRVEAVPDKIDGVQLPTLVLWLDGERTPVRSEADMPGLGMLLLVRTSAKEAQAPGAAAATGLDIGFGQLIRTNQRIPQPYQVESAVYRVTVKGDDNPATTFARDDRQEVKNVRGESFELHVRSRRPTAAAGKSEKPGPEYLASCYFIASADARVQDLARRAVGSETDPWQKALRIEKWVHDHMRSQNFTEAFATADHVARTLEGDCTEYTVLAAAMCRAGGVPSRTAVGLLYVNGGRGPAFGFHMWFEVWCAGQWVPLDATLGRGYVGATHLKIADHSWHDIQSLTPLLPVFRVLGKVSIDVVQTDGGR
jgi:hypothetical protein